MADPYTVRVLRAFLINRITSLIGPDDRDVPESLGDLPVLVKGRRSAGWEAAAVLEILGLWLAVFGGLVGALGLLATLVVDRFGVDAVGWLMAPLFIPLGASVAILFAAGSIGRATSGGLLHDHRFPWFLTVWALPIGFVVALVVLFTV